MRKLMAMLLGSALVAATMIPADAAPRRFHGGRFAHGGGLGFHHGGHGFRPGGFHRQRFGGGPRFRGGYGHGFRNRGYGYGYGYRHRGYGPAIGAGVAGLAAGALIGGAIASQNAAVDPGYVAAPGGDTTAYCERRFKSYDPASGTYLGYDGQRHPCP